MSHAEMQSSNVEHMQNDIFECQENGLRYSIMNGIPHRTSNEMSYEQLQAYYNATAHLVSYNYGQPIVYGQQGLNDNDGQQTLPVRPPMMQNQQRVSLQTQHMITSTNMPPVRKHAATEYLSSKEKQQASPITFHPVVRIPRVPHAMTNPTNTSTPTKRGHGDVSSNSESHTNSHQQQQRTRVFNAKNTPMKRLRGNPQQGNGVPTQPAHDLLGQWKQTGTTVAGSRNRYNQQQPLSDAAHRFATSRYPFSPFSIIFQQEVRDKNVVDDLITHALKAFSFELKTVAYRRARAENNECRVLVFVENTESFAFLYDKSHWPPILAERTYTTKTPSIPPQLSLVLPSVSLQIEWEEFVEEIKEKYVDIVNVIRFKNKAQVPVRSVKLEFCSPNTRNAVFREGEVSVMHMKYKVVEYYALANVLICSNCHGIGHFRNKCPQSEEATCKVCGDKCLDLKAHECSGIAKCIHCAGEHNSNDAKCSVVKDYRAALTRNLLGNFARNSDHANNRPMTLSGDQHPRTPYTTVEQLAPPNFNDIMSKKLDCIIAKVEEESKKTRDTLEEFKDEMKGRVASLEQKVESLQTEFNDYSKIVNRRLSNICKAMLDPVGTRDASWVLYWQEQIAILSNQTASTTPTLQ